MDRDDEAGRGDEVAGHDAWVDRRRLLHHRYLRSVRDRPLSLIYLFPTS